MRNATSESCRISLSASCDIEPRAYSEREPRMAAANGLRGDRGGVLEMLMGGAVVAAGQWCALTGLALPGGRVAARDAAVEETRRDLLLDERRGRADTLTHRPRDLGLRPDREVAANVG